MTVQLVAHHPSVERGGHLARSAAALVVNSGLTSALGVLFWAVAARRFSPADVGAVATVATLIVFLANLSELNLSSMLARFLPTAGESRRSLLLRSYALASVLGLAVGVIAMAIGRHDLALLRRLADLGPAGYLWFGGTVAVWCVFAMQDAAAVALRGAAWIPLENSLFGVGKLLLAFGLASVAPELGLFAALSIPTFLIVIPMNLVIFGVLVRREDRAQSRREHVSRRQLGGFLGAEYLTSLATASTLSFVPLIVAATQRAERVGYFALVWMIYAALESAVNAVGMSVVAEGARDPAQLLRAFGQLRRFAVVVVVGLGAVVLAAPLLLRSFGADYVANSTGLLRVLILAAGARVIIVAAMATNRVLFRTWRVFGLQLLLTTAVVASIAVACIGTPSLDRLGVTVSAVSGGVAVIAWFELRRSMKLIGRIAVLEARRPKAPVTAQADAAGPLPTNPRGVVSPIVADAHTATHTHTATLTAVRGEFVGELLSESRGGAAARGQRPNRKTSSRPARYRVRLYVAAALTLAGMIVWATGLQSITRSDISEMGLIGALRPQFFVGAAMVTFGFIIALAGRDLAQWVLRVQVGCIVLVLHGTALIIEPLPRFTTTWLHAGITDYVARTGKTLPGVDARFSWPAFFAGAATVARGAGVDNPIELARFVPVLVNLVSAVGVYAIASMVTSRVRVRYVAVWLFLLTNWVGQDYFAPQAIAYLLALAFNAILLFAFRSNDGSSMWARRSRLGRLLAALPPEEPGRVLSRTEDRVLVVALIGIYAALVVSHQLTPPVVLATTTALVILGRCRVRTLPLVMFAIFITWLSFGAKGYWSGHLDDLFGGFGRITSAFDQNVNNRLNGSPSRLIVQRIRLSVIAVLLGLAFVGFVRRWRAGRCDLSLLVLAFVPVAVVIAQPYGGEALLRALYFSLPALCTLAAIALEPVLAVRRAIDPRPLLVAVLLTGLIPMFVVSRYGNEKWDYTSLREFEALEFMYDAAPPGATFVSYVSETPWGYRDFPRINYEPAWETKILSSAAEVERVAAGHGEPVFLYVSDGQAEFGRIFGGLPADWADVITRELIAGSFDVVYQNEEATILRYRN